MGEGFFGSVSKARDVDSGEIVAMKVFRETSISLTGPALMSSFLQEKHVLADLGRYYGSDVTLKEPPINQMVDEHDRIDHIILFNRLIPGIPMSRLDLPSLSITEVDRIEAAVSESVKAFHQATDMIHADLHEDNIMLQIHSDGQRISAELVDFGLARVPHGPTRARQFAKDVEDGIRPLGNAKMLKKMLFDIEATLY